MLYLVWRINPKIRRISPLSKWSVHWLLVTIALAGVAFAAGQDLPDGEGKEVIEGKCGSCHPLATAVQIRGDQERWKAIVLKMVEYGAPIKEPETAIAVDYLSRHFGPTEADLAASQIERTAKKHIDGICSTCHEASLIRETKATKEEWLYIVRNMNEKGAGLSESDVELLADFLAKNYGPK